MSFGKLRGFPVFPRNFEGFLHGWTPVCQRAAANHVKWSCMNDLTRRRFLGLLAVTPAALPVAAVKAPGFFAAAVQWIRGLVRPRPRNDYLTVDMITRSALQVLAKNLTFVKSINHVYDEDFAFVQGESWSKIGETVTVRHPRHFAGRSPDDADTITLSISDYVLC
jgi:hypothetical protein